MWRPRAASKKGLTAKHFLKAVLKTIKSRKFFGRKNTASQIVLLLNYQAPPTCQNFLTQLMARTIMLVILWRQSIILRQQIQQCRRKPSIAVVLVMAG